MTSADGDDRNPTGPQPREVASADDSAHRAARERTARADVAAVAFEQSDASLAAGETFEQVGASTGEFPAEQDASQRESEGAAANRHAFHVMAGILLSRVVGLVRQRVMAYYFGTTDVGDAFSIALRIPNFLQNVFGEGALSASFIPVYAGLLADDENEEADRVAGAVFTLLALVTSVIVLLGVLFTPYIISVIALGYTGAKRDLTISLVRIFFPSTGLLVLSAWCLGVLNSHRRFFLSYTAPVLWNLAIIAALLFYGRYNSTEDALGRLAQYTAWGSVVGSALQFGVQLPTVLRLLTRLRVALDVTSSHVREVIRNFIPVFFSRGVVQISAFVDAMLASLLGQGAVVALNYTQSLYTLPVSLFGMSVSAAELPAMSSERGSDDERAAHLRTRLDSGLRRIAFFIVPSAMAFLALGDVIVGVLYRTGRFTQNDTYYVWAILAGSTVGLLASTLGRLYSSTYYALHDTRTPLVFAVVRVVLTTVLGYLCALPLPRALGLDLRWGAVGLTASAGVSGWIEFYLLRRSLNRRIGRTGLAASFVAKLWVAALAGAGAAWAIKLSIGKPHPFFVAILVLIPYGLIYFAAAALLKVPESGTIISRFLRPLRRLTG
ncbi:MAG: murein biosynthesis integral membrane protein MurJ [Acidobacteria bacterium]|nr:murein biosynthesis integral membrane protein MurJ [Acidobacteriota bacterium]